MEEDNLEDWCVVVVVKVERDIVGHMPQEISKFLLYFIKNGGTVDGEICEKKKTEVVWLKRV